MPKKIVQPKETILKYAREILETEGYEALNVRNLAKCSGVSVGTIYNYFEDKRVLDMYVMTAFWSEYEQLVQTILTDDSRDFYGKLRKIESEMNHFVTLFRDLFSQVMQNKNHTYSEKERSTKNQMIKRMSLMLEREILKENPDLATGTPNPEDIADWIMNSMMMINHMKGMNYPQLEKFIKKMMA